MNKRVLILSPHTDDAELGCGGMIAKYLEEGSEIFWVVFSTAEESLPGNLPKDTLTKEFTSVTNYLGIKESNILIYNFKVRKLHENRQDILEILIKLRKEFNPNLVVGPSINDFHQDHIVIANEMIRAFKMNSSIICYELPWNHVSFNSQLFVKLDEKHMEKKLYMLNFYKSQIDINRFYFSEDFIKGLAYTRGAQVGCRYAESFEVIRWIV